uniref:Uncharacterized protein n=1 Tax=Rhizophora mucronata TaxID=61149 RepID=A0A2P2PH35_RHIMU
MFVEWNPFVMKLGVRIMYGGIPPANCVSSLGV